MKNYSLVVLTRRFVRIAFGVLEEGSGYQGEVAAFLHPHLAVSANKRAEQKQNQAAFSGWSLGCTVLFFALADVVTCCLEQ